MAYTRRRGDSYQIEVSNGYDVYGRQLKVFKTWNIPQGMSGKKAEKEAERIAILFEEAVRNGETLGDNVKLYVFIDKFVKDYASQQLRERTYDSYMGMIPTINEHMGHLQIAKIRPQHLLDFYSKLQESKVIRRYTIKMDFKSYLKEKGFTQVKCAEALGVSLHTIKLLCSGSSINTNNAKKVAEKLNLSLKKDFNVVENEYSISNKTIQNYHRLLSSIFTQAVMWQIIPSNPAMRCKPPRVEKVRVDSLESDDVERMLEELNKEPIQFQTAVIVSVYCGTRRGELCGLKWSDIDFETRTMAIQRTIQRSKDKGLFIDETKNESSLRVIKIPHAVSNILREYKGWQSEQRLLMGDAWQDENWIFTRHDGRVKNPNDFTIAFKKFACKIGLPNDTHLHSLRHTNASLLIASNVNLQTVANRLGHSDTTTTSRIYSHAINQRDAEAADTLDILLNSKGLKAVK